MTAAAAALNIVVGLVYFQYGTMTAIEMRRNWGEMGWSRFGIAWMLMAFTCGPHHPVHGITSPPRTVPRVAWTSSRA
jgi:hypothetical protein